MAVCRNIKIIPNPGANGTYLCDDAGEFPAINSDFGRTIIDGLLFPMSPVSFSMSACNLGRMGFVDLCQFVYKNLQDCSLEEIRPQQNEKSVVVFFYALATDRK